MIYWFTGQPGHGKTLHAIDQAIDFRDQGRLVYVCNVRGFQHDKARMLPMSPEQFRDWMNFLPEGSVALVDEAYEHEMLPKRAAGTKVPLHVQQLAKHRHTGIDFIFVSQSPAKQVDDFVHDLIERHVHVRRRFGLPFAHLRIFDRFERNPEKGFPLILKRVKLPKRPMGLYESTVLDTTERRIPWYYPAAALLLVGIVAGAFYVMNDVKAKLSGEHSGTVIAAQTQPDAPVDGAGATAAGGAGQPTSRTLRETDYVAWLTPRIGGQPWSAPAYDTLNVPSEPPRLFCASAGAGEDVDGNRREASCTCLTDQGTRYVVEQNRCRMIATDGQYEPFLNVNNARLHRMDELSQRSRLEEGEQQRRGGGVGGLPPTETAVTGATITAKHQVSGYGDIGARAIESAPR